MRYRIFLSLQEITPIELEKAQIWANLKLEPKTAKAQIQKIEKFTAVFESETDAKARLEAKKIEHLFKDLFSNGRGKTSHKSLINLSAVPKYDLVKLKEDKPCLA